MLELGSGPFQRLTFIAHFVPGTELSVLHGKYRNNCVTEVLLFFVRKRYYFPR